MNKVYQMQFDSDFYEQICDLLSDYEYADGDNYQTDMYELLIAIQSMMAEAIN